MQLLKGIMGIKFGLAGYTFSLLSFHWVAFQGNISTEESFIMCLRCYHELVLRSGEREWQWHPKDGAGVGACGQARESSPPLPTRGRGTCWCRSLSRSPSFHVISWDLNKILLALQSIKIERMKHQEFYLITFTLEADSCVWLAHLSLGTILCCHPYFTFLAFLDRYVYIRQ